MNWEAIGAVGEVGGAIAVVATLGYLAVQIRYTHRIAADTNRQTRAAGVREMMMMMATNREFRTSWHKAAGGVDIYHELAEQFDLTNDEASIVDHGVMYWVWLHWAQYNSTMAEKDQAELRSLIADYYSRDPMRSYLEKSPNLGTHDPEFLGFVREVISAKKG